MPKLKLLTCTLKLHPASDMPLQDERQTTAGKQTAITDETTAKNIYNKN